MDDEDEDVVFENSALHRHLRDAGLDDDDVRPEQKVVRTGDPGPSGGSDHQDPSSTRQSMTLWSRICTKVVDYVLDETWLAEMKNMCGSSAGQLTDECVRHGAGLLEEDAVYVEAFSSSLRLRADTEEGREGEPGIMSEMCTQVGVLAVTIAYGFFRMFYAKSPDLTTSLAIYFLDFLSVAITTIALAPAAFKFALAGRLVSRLHARAFAVTTLLEEVERLQRLIGKATQLIRETELIHRGFTLVTASALRLESSGVLRQCPDLRRALFHCSRRTMLQTRAATRALLARFPARSSLEGVDVSDSLAHAPLDTFGVCVTLDENDEKGLALETDNYSLAALRGIEELMGAQLSELIRVVCILSLVQAEHCQQLPLYNFPTHLPTLLELVSGLRERVRPLERVLALHRELVSRLGGGGGPQRRPLSARSPAGGMYAAMHSLLLHLQAAIARVQTSDAQLEGVVEHGCESLSAALLVELSAVLEGVGREILASRDCCEEAVCRLQKLIGAEPQSTGEPAVVEPCDPLTPSTETSLKPTVVIPQSNPVVEDQVFEGMTSEDLSESSSSQRCNSDETAVDRREVMRVLTELRSVIAVRARDTAQREQRAIMRQSAHTQHDYMAPTANQSLSDLIALNCSDANHYATTDQSLSDLMASNTAAQSPTANQSLSDLITLNSDTANSNDCNHRVGKDRHVSQEAVEDSNIMTRDIHNPSTIDDLCRPLRIGRETSDERRRKYVYDESSAGHSAANLFQQSDVSAAQLDADEAGAGEDAAALNGSFPSVLARLAVARFNQLPVSAVETFGDESESGSETGSDDEADRVNVDKADNSGYTA